MTTKLKRSAMNMPIIERLNVPIVHCGHDIRDVIDGMEAVSRKRTSSYEKIVMIKYVREVFERPSLGSAPTVIMLKDAKFFVDAYMKFRESHDGPGHRAHYYAQCVGQFLAMRYSHNVLYRQPQIKRFPFFGQRY